MTGRDGGDFLIDRESGTLTFRNPPNYEQPVDYNGDNTYELVVRAYDGRNYGNFDVTVTVLEVNEGPEITGREQPELPGEHAGRHQPPHLPGHRPRG